MYLEQKLETILTFICIMKTSVRAPTFKESDQHTVPILSTAVVMTIFFSVIIWI